MDTATITEPSGTCRCDQPDERCVQLMLGHGHAHLEASSNENWRSDHDVADPVHIARLLSTTLQSVMAFDERWPVTIGVLGADSPCEACFWEA